MATPAPAVPEATGLWQGGFSGPGLPALGGAVVIAAQLPDDGAGRPGFLRGRHLHPAVLDHRPTGSADHRDPRAGRGRRRPGPGHRATAAPGSGLDEVPLREFVEAVRLHFQLDA